MILLLRGTPVWPSLKLVRLYLMLSLYSGSQQYSGDLWGPAMQTVIGPRRLVPTGIGLRRFDIFGGCGMFIQ